MPQLTEVETGKVSYPKLDEEVSPRRTTLTRRPGNDPQSWKKTLYLGLGAVALVGLVAGGIYWSQRGLITVQTGKIQRQDLASLVTASGEIKPDRENYASVNANSFGKIVELLVNEGDTVKKGQILLKTESVQQEADVNGQEAALRTSLADVAASDAGVQSASASLKTAQADLATARANFNRASEDYQRAEQLLKDSLIAQQLYDQRRNDFEVARAGVDAAQARVAQAEAQYRQIASTRDMARARVGQQRAALVRAQDARSKTIYTSPLDGIITSLPVHLGENVVPGIQNQVGSVLFQIADLSIITAEVKVDETEILNVKLGQPAEVTIDAIPGKTFKGHVTEMGQSAVGRTSGLTSGTSAATAEEAKDFKVVVTLESPPPNLRPGLSTTARITTATRQNVVTVPIQALTMRTRRELEETPQSTKGKALAASKPPATASAPNKDKGKEDVQGLFVVRGGVAIFRPVETGIMGTTDVEILKGVEPGDEIVTGSYAALRTLKNNTKVKVDNTPRVRPTGTSAEGS